MSAGGGPTDDDWKKITKLVDQFYNRADAGTFLFYSMHGAGGVHAAFQPILQGCFFLRWASIFLTEPFRAPVDWKNLGEYDKHFDFLRVAILFCCYGSKQWMWSIRMYGRRINPATDLNEGRLSIDTQNHSNNNIYFSPMLVFLYIILL
jgi:hypothetical protein